MLGKEYDSGVCFLRLFLIVAGVGWGICLAAAFLPVNMVNDFVAVIDAESSFDTSLMKYFMRMTGAVFGGLGLYFFLLAVKPKDNLCSITFWGYFHLFLIAVLIYSAFSLKFFDPELLVDVVFCLVVGVGLLLSVKLVRLKAVSQPEEEQAE